MQITIPSAVASNMTFGPDIPQPFYDKSIEDMTLRDHYALAFMMQMLNTGIQKGDAPLAQMAIKRAEALLTELQRNEP